MEQEIFFSYIFFYKLKDFLVILTLHHSKNTCDRRKQIVDLESSPKNTSVKK